MNHAFDLKGRCLSELITGPNRLEDSLMLAAASQAYNATDVPFNRTGSWDQLNWAQYWSRVFKAYNPYDRKYCTERKTRVDSKTKRVIVICDSEDGLSTIIRSGLRDYDPFVPSPAPVGP